MSINNIISLTSYKLNIVLLTIALSFVSSAYATDIRGRVDLRIRGRIFPMNGAFVKLCQQGRGCLSYRTGYDGMYYFNVAPGSHNVSVNGRTIRQLFIPNQRFFDIQPLRGN